MTCISNWQDLFGLFQKEARENRTTLFPSSRRIYPMLLIHIHNWTHLHNKPVTINSSRPCQPLDSEDECMIIAVYSHSVFAVYPPALLMSLVFEIEHVQRFKFWLRSSIEERSWILPLPFCSGHLEYFPIVDFVYEVSGALKLMFLCTCEMPRYCILAIMGPRLLDNLASTTIIINMHNKNRIIIH